MKGSNMIEKKFNITIELEEGNEDFCFIDLREAIFDGIDNIGNHIIYEVKEDNN